MANILYTVTKRQRREGAGICYEITTENGSVLTPIPSLEILQQTLTEKYGATDSECARVIAEVEESEKSEIYMRDGSGMRIYKQR
jgi:hypothetical protein